MDLNDFNLVEISNAGAELKLVHPNPEHKGTPIDTVLMVRGFDSPEVVAAGREASKAKMADDPKNLEGAIDVRKVAMAKAAVISVQNLSDGKKEITTGEELAPFLENPAWEWIVDQIVEFGGRRANFFPKPPKS